MTSSPHSEKRPVSLLATVAGTGLLAGTLDICSAFIYAGLASGTSPAAVLRYVASGVWGAEAFSGGVLTALSGLLFHYFIALSWTVLFFLAAHRLSFLHKHPAPSAALYGIFVWCVMNLLVVPLSNVPARPLSLKPSAINMLILVVAIGVPVAYSARRYFSTARV